MKGGIYVANEKNYYMLMYAIVEQAINDYLASDHGKKVPKAYKMTDDDLERFLHRMFSDDSLVDRYMRRAKEMKAEGRLTI